ncbi:MAG: hypothetical protein HKO66_16940 [Saprospiraceae bacterium]|nr:hypothetical protein [Bacteroidia bacterium]NNE16334.1 hypothetical protein [Saprospiraceae bacterium]NNL93932.1 hypothetical protein [Saprospiraceae bacterium]
MVRKIGLILLMGILITSCKNESKEQPKSKTKEAVGYEMLPADILRKMWNEAESLDYIFHHLPFSMNQTEKPSIQANMTYIEQAPQPNVPQGCTPAARQFYQVNGNIELEADIYFSEGCYFYVFIIDGKPKYANKMSEAGKNFFNTMINKAKEATQGAGQ